MATFWAVRHNDGWRIRGTGDDGKPVRVDGTVHKSKALVAQELARLRKLHPPRARGRKATARVVAGAMPYEKVIQAWQQSKATLASAEHSAGRLRKFFETAKWSTTADCTVAAWRRVVTEHPKLAGRPTALLKGLLRWAERELDQPVQPEMRTLPVPASRESERELMSPPQYLAIRDEFATLGQLPVFEFLTTYGWRPASAEALTIDRYDRVERTISLRIKGRSAPYTIPVHEYIHEHLLDAIDGRTSGPVFLSMSGVPWNGQLKNWAGRVVHRNAAAAGRSYALKRFALTRMERGWWPWPRPLDLRSIRLFTGHKTDSQAARYLRTNLKEARALVGEQITSEWDLFDLRTRQPRREIGVNTATTPTAAQQIGPELPPLPTNFQPLTTK